MIRIKTTAMHRTYWIICLQLLGFLNLTGQTLTTEQQAFLQRNGKMVCQEADFSLADWSAVSKAVKNKRIVLIGEPNHGSAEIFRLRNGLIKHFHEKLRFNVILFESGMGELLLADFNKSEMTPAQLTTGLIGGWRTPEFEALMAYVKTAELSIAGFDVQRSGGSFSGVLKSIAQKKSVDTTRYVNLEERYGALSKKLTHKKAVYDSVSVETRQLIADYQSCYQALYRVKEPKASKRFWMVLQVIQNRISYLNYMLEFLKDKNWDKRWAARDSAMAGNLVFLCEKIFKNEKILVVGHNYHIAKFNENQLVMGELLKGEYPKEWIDFAEGGFPGGWVGV